MSEQTNFYPNTAFIKRLGYYGFLSAVWMLWKMNRNARQLDIKSKCEITLPMPWLK